MVEHKVRPGGNANWKPRVQHLDDFPQFILLKTIFANSFVDSKLNNFLVLFFSDEFDAYIIVSFVNATLVLSIGDTVEEVTDSGFLGTTPTLCCSALGDDALVQVYPDGIRHIRADRRVNEWKAPNKKTIVKCAVNQRQVVIALSGGELVYFEMDPVSVATVTRVDLRFLMMNT